MNKLTDVVTLAKRKDSSTRGAATSKRAVRTGAVAVCLAAACITATSEGGAEQPVGQHQGSNTAAAAEQDVTLGVIVVTAERFPVEHLASTRNVEVLAAERLKATATPNLVEALRQTAGTMSYKASGPQGVSHGGMSSQFSIRGMRGGELVLFNGMPIQSAAGGDYNLDTLSVGQAEAVEILKGAGSVLYGADAESGAINFVTRKRRGDKPFRFSLDAGSRESLNVQGGWSDDLLDLDVDYRHLGGQEEICRSYSGGYRYDSTPLDKFGFGAIAELSDSLTLDVLGGGYNIGFRKIADSDDLIESSDQNYLWNFTDLRLEREHLDLKAFAGYGQMQMDRLSGATSDNRNSQAGAKGDYRYSLGILEHTIGGDYVYRAANYNQQYGHHDRQDIGLVTEAKLTPWERLTVSLGAREQFILADSAGNDYDRFLPCAGVNLRLIEGLHAFADSGKAFRAPTFNQMYYESDFLVGNPSLGPEEGWTHQAGLKFDSQLVSGSVAVFRMDYDNRIALDRASQPSSYINADSFESGGVDWDIVTHPFLATGTLLEPLALELSGYVADGTAETPSGVRSQSGDHFQIAPGVSYGTDRWRAGLRLACAADRENDLSDYCTVNLNATVCCLGGWVKAGVQNLTDETVVTSGNMSPSSMNRYEYYGTSRTLTVGYETAF